jgi:L-malate glycosyltransferase
MKVMHVVLSLRPGGTERLVVDLCRAMQPDVPSCVCCLDEAGDWAAGLQEDGIDVVVLGRTPGFHPSLGRRIAAAARERAVTVLHCHQYSPFVYGSLAGLLVPALRVVFTEHGRISDAPPSRKRALVNRVLGLRPDRIVAVSHELRDFMIAEGFRPSAVGVIHNGIDAGPAVAPGDRERARQRLGLPPTGMVIGSVARFDPVKRFDVLMRAFRAVAQEEPGARLVLVGDGPERARLEALADECGVRPAVAFTGIRHDARALMPAFDVYANTSDSEGISITILEAMATSLPVVATRVGGTPEIVEAGASGELVAAREEAGIAAALVQLLRDPQRRSAIGDRARARVVDRFSRTRMVQQYLEAYRVRGNRREHGSVDSATGGW